MSDKPKKPFLKKGTRQFLSNAQVRSQNNKPKVVDFGAEEDEGYAPTKPAPVRNSYEERPITAKKPPEKTPPLRPTKVIAQQPPKRNMPTE